MASIVSSFRIGPFQRHSSVVEQETNASVSVEQAARLAPEWARLEVSNATEQQRQMLPLFSRHF